MLRFTRAIAEMEHPLYAWLVKHQHTAHPSPRENPDGHSAFCTVSSSNDLCGLGTRWQTAFSDCYKNDNGRLSSIFCLRLRPPLTDCVKVCNLPYPAWNPTGYIVAVGCERTARCRHAVGSRDPFPCQHYQQKNKRIASVVSVSYSGE